MLLSVIKEENQEVSHQEQMYEAAYGKVRFYQEIMKTFYLFVMHNQNQL